MNLKNSKFFKRIQTLRRISKEKIRKEKERNRLDFDLANCFQERNGIEDSKMEEPFLIGGSGSEDNSIEQIKLRQQQFLVQQCEQCQPVEGEDDTTVNGLIHFNNTCFQVKGITGVPPKKRSSNESLPTISMCVCHSRYTIIGKVAKTLGFRMVKDNKLWNILWTDSLAGVELYKNMKRFQQVNHFPGMMEICRKDLLSRNLNRMLKLYPKEYKIFPKTWVFPADYGDALNYSTSRAKPVTFIIKPDAGAQGRGIWLTNDLKTINPSERMICQTYISKPLLIDGYKFDLRVYALITSVDPLRIFVYNEGLARFATSKYVEPTPDNRCDLFMHLTNYSVNRRNSHYEMCDNDDCGSKRKLSAINTWLRRRNHNVDEFWSKIDDILIKTILSAWPMLKHNYHACFAAHDRIQACFEILGFDILVDSKLRPYILEVNHSPSFHTNELVDRQVKKPLIKDTLNLVATALADKRQILREDRKRVKQRLLKSVKQGNVNSTNNTTEGNNQNGSPKNKTLSSNSTGDCPLSALAQQIAWEESHLGDFRRIMPPTEPNKLNYYCQFYGVQNQASIYAETAASKKREEVAKKMRMELEAKRRKQNEMHSRPGTKFEDRSRKRARVPRDVIEKNRLTQLRNQAHWTPGFISMAEERLRASTMQMRSDLLREMKIMESIYTNLYNAGNLTSTDILKFPDLYRSLEEGTSITSMAESSTT
ncbi:tubulin tyrosine ligase-like 6B [Glossina fuscipes fuscipes]